MSHVGKTGLVLSGGGAVGAYQVGVIKALHQSGVAIDLISGASIGALNGAILASAPSIQAGIERLEEVWQTLASTSPLRGNPSVYLNYLLSAGVLLTGGRQWTLLVKSIGTLAKQVNLTLPAFLQQNEGLLSEQPLTRLMDRYLDLDALQKGLPLYVSVYETHGGTVDLFNYLLAETGLRDTAPSRFLHVQAVPVEQQKAALLASAALPLLFKSQEVGGKRYSDGGIGGWQKMQGNTPVTPLIEAGCDRVIVTHLRDGSLWDRHDFQEATILEIRPQSTLARSKGAFSGVRDLLGFHPDTLASWIEQGYQDTLKSLEKIIAALQACSALAMAEQQLELSMQKNAQVDETLATTLSRLKP
ncbi:MULTISPECIES: patatin-like phospholipase family protein [unclassified Serratia (in: enterobacteria)]|uniref:patatin-like phospholipase family protein n=1 Tax=unclassified Serratia (in: enterobacteria) TaxID=2647522 RepID=UPI003076444C